MSYPQTLRVASKGTIYGCRSLSREARPGRRARRFRGSRCDLYTLWQCDYMRKASISGRLSPASLAGAWTDIAPAPYEWVMLPAGPWSSVLPLCVGKACTSPGRDPQMNGAYARPDPKPLYLLVLRCYVIGRYWRQRPRCSAQNTLQTMLATQSSEIHMLLSRNIGAELLAGKTSLQRSFFNDVRRAELWFMLRTLTRHWYGLIIHSDCSRRVERCACC